MKDALAESRVCGFHRDKYAVLLSDWQCATGRLGKKTAVGPGRLAISDAITDNAHRFAVWKPSMEALLVLPQH
ncbi:protein of unknown function [Serratia sp. Tan611]|nr:protein of unknown function [Serratia sp. Tan611]